MQRNPERDWRKALPLDAMRLRPMHWKELANLPRLDPLVKRLLDLGGKSVLYGESNSGKTFLGLDIAAHVALGWPWRDLRVKQCPVLYISAEGMLGIEKRIDAFRHHHEPDDQDLPLFIIAVDVDLCRSTDDADAILKHISEMDMKPGLIVVDTLAAAFGSGNENSPDDMNSFLAIIRRLCAVTGAHVMIVHHTGKDTARGARGHSALRAAADTEIEVVADQDGNRTATVTKQRDGETGAEFHFRLESIEVGQDADGDSITSCVVTPADTGPGRNRKRKGPTLTPKERRAMDALHECLIDTGKPAPGSDKYPSGVRVVTAGAWKDMMRRRGVLSEDSNSARQQWKRLHDNLSYKDQIAEYNGLIWSVTGSVTP